MSISFFKAIVPYILLISILIFAYILATIYDFASKKCPGMDLFVAGAIFFLILFGAATVSIEQIFSNPLIWIVALIGSVQVLFMNMINYRVYNLKYKSSTFDIFDKFLSSEQYHECKRNGFIKKQIDLGSYDDGNLTLETIIDKYKLLYS